MRSGRARVGIVGTGVVSPVGRAATAWTRTLEACATPTVEEFWLGDRSRAVPVFRAAPEGASFLTRSESRRLDRAHLLAADAVDQAIDGLAGCVGHRTAIVLGSAVGPAGFAQEQHRAALERFTAINPFAAALTTSSSMASWLAQKLHVHGPVLTINTTCASGATALAAGAAMLQAGEVDRVIAGGVDAPLTDPVIAFFCRMEAINQRTADLESASCPFDADRAGFVPGEGAAVVVLERADEATSSPVALLSGFASTTDGHHPVAPLPTGIHAAAALTGALASAGMDATMVRSVNAHGTSTPLNDATEGRVIRDLFGPDVPVTANKGVTGHMLGGSGAFEAVAAVRTASTGSVPPVGGLRHLDRALSIRAVRDVPVEVGPGPVVTCSFGFGGHNTALVLEPA